MHINDIPGISLNNSKGNGESKFTEVDLILLSKRPCAVAFLPCFQLSENYAKARTTHGGV